MKFSFVMPAFKSRFLTESIQSILNQTYKDFELIIVDDCSPDNIRAVVDSFHDERITYIRNEQNIGGKDLVGQWNNCLKHARGEYVILATDDDTYAPQFLSEANNAFYRHQESNLFMGRVLSVDANGNLLNIDNTFQEYLSQVEFYYHMFHNIKGGIPQYVFKREILLGRGGFVNFIKAWGSDDATALLMSDKGVVTSPLYLVNFRFSEYSVTGTSSLYMDKLKARLQLSSWLKEHIKTIQPEKKWEHFFNCYVVNYMPFFIRERILTEFRVISGFDWFKAINLVLRSTIDRKEKLAVVGSAFLMVFKRGIRKFI